MTEALTLDSQVHAYERNHPGRPWSGKLHGPDEATGDPIRPELITSVRPSRVPPPLANPWTDLGKVTSLAVHDNVSIKISCAGTLSHEPFPYPDLWQPLSQIFRAFGRVLTSAVDRSSQG